MSARAAILAALRPDETIPDETGPDEAGPADLAAQAAALLIGNERDVAAGEPLADAFIAKLSLPSVAASHHRIAAIDALPGAVAAYLARQGGPPSVYLPPDPRLAACDWRALDILPVCPIDGGAVLAIASAGVAETGSLVFDTAPTAPMLPNFLALHHLVLLERTAIVAWLEDVAPPPPPGPRTRYWVTGVSGTTDIEGQYVRGAHGPRFLHVIILD